MHRVANGIALHDQDAMIVLIAPEALDLITKGALLIEVTKIKHLA